MPRDFPLTTRFRVPDVAVLDQSQPIEQIITRPPIAVFEILSPEDRMPQVMQKLADYAGMGIRTIIVVDPGADEVWSYREGTLSRQVPKTLAGVCAGSTGTLCERSCDRAG